MKSAPEPSRTDSTGLATGELTSESIALVKDFTARKTLEQAHALAHGLAEVFVGADEDRDAADLARRLTSAGLTLADAQQIASAGAALIQMMAERDRHAELFHAAVLAASEGERVLYDRLSSLAGLLRVRLGARAPSLAQFGVPPESADTLRCYGRALRPETQT